jgi:hypothetical protein
VSRWRQNEGLSPVAAAAAAGAAAGSAGGGYGTGRYDESTLDAWSFVVVLTCDCDCFCRSGARLLVEGGRLLLPSYGWMEKDAPDARPRTPTR